MFIYTHWEEGRPEPEVFAVRLQVLPSRHITIDLQEDATRVVPGDQKVWALERDLPRSVEKLDVLHSAVEEEPFLPLYVFENVNVVVKDDVPLVDRLQSLAHRLQALAVTRSSDESSRASSMRRPSSNRVPMLREALWESQDKQICSVGDVPSMWPSLSLHEQERLQWRDPPYGSRSGHASVDPARHGKPDSSRSMHREVDHREGHGSSRQMVATRFDDQSCSQHDLGGVSQEDGHTIDTFEGSPIDYYNSFLSCVTYNCIYKLFKICYNMFNIIYILAICFLF